MGKRGLILAGLVVALLATCVTAWLINPAESPRIDSGTCAEPEPTSRPQPIATVEPKSTDPDGPPRELGKVFSDSQFRSNPYGLPDPGRLPPRTTPGPTLSTDAESECDSPTPADYADLAGPGSSAPPDAPGPVDDGSGPWPLASLHPKSATSAMRWLADNQAKNGSWSDGTTDAEGNPTASVFTSAMALLANLRRAASHKEGEMRANVRAVILWQRKTQASDGNFAASEKADPILHHAAATLTIVEAYGNTGDHVLKPLADKSLEYLAKARSSVGGWGMTANDPEPNVTATGWALLALQRAKQAGLRIDEEALNDAALWAWTLRRNGYIAWSSYRDQQELGAPAPDDATMADAVFLCALKWAGYELAGEPSATAALERLMYSRPVWDGTGNDLMAWMFTTVALHAMAVENTEDWKANVLQQINDAATTELGENRQERASWISSDYWSRRFGKVYTTAMASILQTHCEPTKEDE